MRAKRRMPRYCSMKGMLSFRILCYLRKGEKSGQEIAGLIEKSRGRKPSPGTIYPALKELAKLQLVRRKQRGRVVVYFLTVKGREEADLAWRYFRACFSDML